MDIYVINLKHREDRWNKLLNIWKNTELFSINLIRVDAIYNKDNGAIGCFQSHQKCIEIAKTNGLKKILVIEDDCVPINYNNINDNINDNIDDMGIFYDKILKLNDILDNIGNWNILYGAGNKIRVNNIIKKIIYDDENINNEKNINTMFDIYETIFLKTAHFVWYNNSVYDYILNLNSYIDYPIDKCWHNKFNVLIIIPFITTQYDDYSDIENKKCSYTKSIKRYERRLINNINNIN